jgi:hypothetical protein
LSHSSAKYSISEVLGAFDQAFGEFLQHDAVYDQTAGS